MRETLGCAPPSDETPNTVGRARFILIPEVLEAPGHACAGLLDSAIALRELTYALLEVLHTQFQ